MIFPFRGARVMRTFGTGLTMQALLSGANFAVGLILIRRTSDLQYSYYILATNALLLLTALQTSFIQPYIVTSITRMDVAGRHDIVGALVRANRRWVPILCASAVAVTAVLWAVQVLGTELTLLIAISLIAGGTALSREFFRVTLFAYHRPLEALRGDIAYVVLLIAGAFLATLTSQPALFAVAGVGLAALIASSILSRGLWKHEQWNPNSFTGCSFRATAISLPAFSTSGTSRRLRPQG
jgi:hypothetical protein